TFLAYWNAFVGVEENFGYPCYPSPSQLRTEGASMIENIIREVKAEIQKLNQVVRLLEGTKATKQATAPRRKMSAAGRRRIAAAQKQGGQRYGQQRKSNYSGSEWPARAGHFLCLEIRSTVRTGSISSIKRDVKKKVL